MWCGVPWVRVIIVTKRSEHLQSARETFSFCLATKCVGGSTAWPPLKIANMEKERPPLNNNNKQQQHRQHRQGYSHHLNWSTASSSSFSRSFKNTSFDFDFQKETTQHNLLFLVDFFRTVLFIELSLPSPRLASSPNIYHLIIINYPIPTRQKESK